MLTYTMNFGLAENSPARMIREAVFMQEQGFENEFDDQDHDSWHFVFFFENNPVGCARLFMSPNQPSWLTLGRVAILKEYRSQHFGKEMLSIIEKEAKQKNALGIELSAQCRVQNFYAKSGYLPIGDIYMDEHCPHIHMEKRI